MKNQTPPIPQLWLEEIQLLTKVVSELPSQSNIVEIGTAQGGGFNLIANSRADPTTIALHTFDPYPGKAISLLTKTHKNTFSYPLTSSQGAKAWCLKTQGKVNLLIIDGSHTLESVYQDYTAWIKHLSHPAEIIFHDYDSIERDGASHPAVKVFCEALLSSGSKTVTAKGREGRYLQVYLTTPPNIVLNDLKRSFSRWITNAIKIAAIFQSYESKPADSLMNQYSCHSRLADQKLLLQGIARHSDLAFTIHAASAVAAIHEILLDRTNARANTLKWIEYLEMFLHARSWNGSCLINVDQNPILMECDKCNDILSLSRLCADITILVGLIEVLFKNFRYPDPWLKSGKLIWNQ